MSVNTVDNGPTVLEEPTSPIHPVAPYPPLETHVEAVQSRVARRRAAGGRAPEVYGFVAWLMTLLVYITYVFWAIVPDQMIQSIGIAWYPAREWAVLLPAWSVVLFLTAYFVYIALGIYSTPPFSDTSTFTDSRAYFIPRNTESSQTEENPYLRFSDSHEIPAPYDIPTSLVNRVLYGRRPRHRDLSVS
ncbi:hypothetical protein FRC15_011730 [Serendipita sp. 397]|nr:hypothetical protein FRC15_011730 [Serendipita sp. 397]